MPGSRLSLEEREEIAVGLAGGLSRREIARGIRRAASTVSREVGRNANRDGGYRAVGAQHKATQRALRPKVRRLDDAELHHRVWELLVEERHSASTVGRWQGLAAETVYREIYRGGFGDPRAVLIRPRRHRQRRTRTQRPPKVLGDYKPISARPGNPKTDPGHWEGDLIVGEDNLSAAAVITECQSRYCRLLALPHGRGADDVAQVLSQALNDIPQPLQVTLTWDQGRELTRWDQIETNTAISIYFADAHSPWQRPLGENQCGLLRRWLKPGQPISKDQATLDIIQHRLNSIPRRSLGGRSAQQAYDQLRGATTV